MSQSLPYDEIEMWKGSPYRYLDRFKDILNTPNDSDIGYFVEVDLRYPDDIKEKIKTVLFAPEIKEKLFLIISHLIWMQTNQMLVHKIRT